MFCKEHAAQLRGVKNEIEAAWQGSSSSGTEISPSLGPAKTVARQKRGDGRPS